MPRFANAFRSSLDASVSSCGMRESSISMIVTSLPKRSKIEANSQPMIPPPRTTRRLGTSVWASRPVESTQRGELMPRIGGRTGIRAGRDDRAREREARVLTLEDDRASVLEAPGALERRHAVGLEERCDSARHLVHDRRLPLVRLGEVERRLARDDSQPGIDLARRVQRVCRLHPGLRRDAADAKARPSELGLLLDADHARPELGRADRCGVAGGTGRRERRRRIPWPPILVGRGRGCPASTARGAS